MSIPVILTLFIVIGVGLVFFVEYGARRINTLITNVNSPNPEAAKVVGLGVGTLAEQFASIRAKVQLTGTPEDVEKFDEFSSFLFRPNTTDTTNKTKVA